jgi:hypothetical protein
LVNPQVLKERKGKKDGREGALGACDQREDSSDQSPAHTVAWIAYEILVKIDFLPLAGGLQLSFGDGWADVALRACGVL